MNKAGCRIAFLPKSASFANTLRFRLPWDSAFQRWSRQPLWPGRPMRWSSEARLCGKLRRMRILPTWPNISASSFDPLCRPQSQSSFARNATSLHQNEWRRQRLHHARQSRWKACAGFCPHRVAVRPPSGRRRRRCACCRAPCRKERTFGCATTTRTAARQRCAAMERAASRASRAGWAQTNPRSVSRPWPGSSGLPFPTTRFASP